MFMSTTNNDVARQNKCSRLTLCNPSTSKPLRFAYREWCLFPNNDVEVTLAGVRTALSKSLCCVLTCSSDLLDPCCCRSGASASSRLSISACAGAGSAWSGRVHRSYITLCQSQAVQMEVSKWPSEVSRDHTITGLSFSEREQYRSAVVGWLYNDESPCQCPPLLQQFIGRNVFTAKVKCLKESKGLLLSWLSIKTHRFVKSCFNKKYCD